MSESSQADWRRASIKLNQNALASNLERVRAFAPDCQVMAVIKANAYGHGMLTAAEQLDDADIFAVAMPGEAYALRAAGCTKPVVVLHGFSNLDELEQFSRENISTVIHQQAQLELLLQHALLTPVNVWIKVDTGMNRLGIPAEELDVYFAQLSNCSNVDRISVMSHFSNADLIGNIMNNNQLSRFLKVINNIEIDRSMANSAAIMRMPESHFDIVRPGIMLYGSSPFADISATDLGLQAAMQFEAPLIDIKTVNAGDSIGYGATYTAKENLTVGIVAAGYGDGYPRHARNGTPVWLNQYSCELLGRVSMDSLCINLTALLESGLQAEIGDRAVLWGSELSVDEVAHHCDSIGYELLCNAGAAFFSYS